MDEEWEIEWFKDVLIMNVSYDIWMLLMLIIGYLGLIENK